MTRRKNETPEDYLARCRAYNQQRYQLPEVRERIKARVREYATVHKAEIAARRHTPEYRERMNVHLRERYAMDPEFREQKKALARAGTQKYKQQARARIVAARAADPEGFRRADRSRGERYRDHLRREALEHYGGQRCACCGESTLAFLSIDHIDGGGNVHRRALGSRNFSGSPFLRWLRSESYPAGYQVLCHNCNFARGHYGTCPHQRPVVLPPVGRSGRQGRALRAETLAAYGGRCSCCGEETPEFLAVDHVNGHRPDGAPRCGDHLYRWLRREGWPAGFRLLCHNCNQAPSIDGSCPHQRAKSPSLRRSAG